MGATRWQAVATSNLLGRLQLNNPTVVFQAGLSFMWSPSQQVVHYRAEALASAEGQWSLIHELAHALLDHQTFTTDFELLQMEVAAWEKAKVLAKQYNVVMDEDHIQDCLDTYRDWLYQRSTCPTCTSCGMQIDQATYQCLNCKTTWQVSASRLCRPYRRKQKVLS